MIVPQLTTFKFQSVEHKQYMHISSALLRRLYTNTLHHENHNKIKIKPDYMRSQLFI